MTERQEEAIYREGYRRGKAERHKMLDDGTLVVSVDDATSVTRVLVEDGQKNGDLYYADRPKGEWEEMRNWRNGSFYSRCSECGYFDDERDDLTAYNFCPYCGSDNRERKEDE